MGIAANKEFKLASTMFVVAGYVLCMSFKQQHKHLLTKPMRER